MIDRPDIVTDMSIRDYFAGQALITLDAPKFFMGAEETDFSLRSFAKYAYLIADAMIKEGQK